MRYLQATLILLIVLGFAFIYFSGETILGLEHTPVSLVIYAFSNQEEVLIQSILPSFEGALENETGQELEIDAVVG